MGFGLGSTLGNMQPFPPALSIPYPRTRLLSVGQGDSLGELSITILPDGAVCSVAGVGVYQLDKTSVAAISAPDIIATSNGSGVPGRWLLITGVAISTLVEPFITQYYVDPAFVGTSTGSASNPFTSIADAFAAAAALALAGAVIILPASTTVTENVVFPSTGGTWEIRSPGDQFSRATISGTVTVNSSVSTTSILSSIIVTGAVSGSTSAAPSLFSTYDTDLSSTCTLSATGGGFWYSTMTGQNTPFFSFGGGIGGAFSVSGGLYAESYRFGGALTLNGGELTGCRFGSTISMPVGGVVAFFGACIWDSGAATIIGVGGMVDAAFSSESYQDALFRGLDLTNCTTRTVNSNLRQVLTRSGNVTPFPLYGGGLTTVKSGAGLYRMTVSLNLIVAGTTGNLTANAIYVDLAGVTQTVAMAVLSNIAAAPGTAAQGFVDFWHDGSAALAFSVTGVVTPGSLSYQIAVAANRLD